MATATFRIWRGEGGTGRFHDYNTEISVPPQQSGEVSGKLVLTVAGR